MAKEIFKKMLNNVVFKNNKKSYSKLNFLKIGTKLCNASIALLIGVSLFLSLAAKTEARTIDIPDIVEAIENSVDNTIEIESPVNSEENEQVNPVEPENPVENKNTIETKYFNSNPISLYFGSQGHDWNETEMAYVIKAIKQLDNQLNNVKFDIYYDKDASFGNGTDSRQNSYNQIILQRVQNLADNILAAYYPIKSNVKEIDGTDVYDENGAIFFSDYVFKFLELTEDDNKLSPSFISSLGPMQTYVNTSMTNKQAKILLENKANAIIMHELCHNNALFGQNHSNNDIDLMYPGATAFGLSTSEKEKFNQKTDITIEVEAENILNSIVYDQILKTIETEFGKTANSTEFKNIRDVELIDYTNGTLTITFNSNNAFDGEQLLSSININFGSYQKNPNSLLDIYELMKQGIENDDITVNSYTYDSTLSENVIESKFATSDSMKDTFLYNDLSIRESKKMTNIATLRAKNISLENYEKTETHNYTLNVDLTFVIKNITTGTRLNNYNTKIKITSDKELTNEEIAQKINDGEFEVLRSYTIFLADNCSFFEQAKLEAQSTINLNN